MNKDGVLTVRETIGPDVWSEPDLSGQDAEVALVEAIDAAIADLSRGQDVFACELSGGLDSSFIVASLATYQSEMGAIRAFTHVPSSEAVLRPGNWVASDADAARMLVERYAPVIDWKQQCNVSQHSPLDVAREVTSRAWWPAYGPANLEWLRDIRAQVARSGLTKVWIGAHGNAAFSVNYTYDLVASGPSRRPVTTRVRDGLRRKLAGRSQRRVEAPAAQTDFLREPPAPVAPLNRRDYLLWLAGHRGVHAGLLNPDAFSVHQVDPYRHPLVLETAARIRPEGWRRPGMDRGLARSASRGRVPDNTRLRVARGAQALDVWHWMFNRRSEYFQELDSLAGTRWLADIIDVEGLRRAMMRWPWGQPEPPSLGEVRRVNRYLAFGRFVTDMSDRLLTNGSGIDSRQQRGA